MNASMLTSVVPPQDGSGTTTSCKSLVRTGSTDEMRELARILERVLRERSRRRMSGAREKLLSTAV